VYTWKAGASRWPRKRRCGVGESLSATARVITACVSSSSSFTNSRWSQRKIRQVHTGNLGRLKVSAQIKPGTKSIYPGEAAQRKLLWTCLATFNGHGKVDIRKIAKKGGARSSWTRARRPALFAMQMSPTALCTSRYAYICLTSSCAAEWMSSRVERAAPPHSEYVLCISS
jgi:hypothetical protein